MKTKYWVVLIVAVVAVCAVLSIVFLGNTAAASRAEVWSDGELLYTLDLMIDKTVTVESENGTNVITVRDGKIAVTEADCPDHYCMDRGFCSGGAQIVCLPNRLVIQFAGEQSIDAAAG